MKPPGGKSRSARAAPHDWTALREAVDADNRDAAPMFVDWDEHYVHALEKALVGRNKADLLRLLDEGRAIHPALLHALADVIRSQEDGARGAGKKLTSQQDALIRDAFDRVGPDLHRDRHPAATVEWLAKALGVSAAVIRQSLKGSEPTKK